MLNQEIANRLVHFYISNKDLLIKKYEAVKQFEDMSFIRMLVHTFNLFETDNTATTIHQDYIDMYQYIDRNDEWLDGAFDRLKAREPETKKEMDKIIFSIVTFFTSYQELQKQKEIIKPSLIYNKIGKIHDFVTDDGTHIDQADIYINERAAGCIIDFRKTYPTAQIGDTIVMELYFPEPHDYETPFTRTRFIELIKNQNN